jgi:hypothetical protein
MQESEENVNRQTEIRHLLRTLNTALELAILARAPSDLLNRLGRVAGLLDAVSQLPGEEGPARAMTPALIADGIAAVAAWEKWHQTRSVSA